MSLNLIPHIGMRSFKGSWICGVFSGPASVVDLSILVCRPTGYHVGRVRRSINRKKLVDLSMLLWKIFRWCVLSTFECSDVATAADCAKVCSDNFMPPISTNLEAMRMSLASLVAVVEL